MTNQAAYLQAMGIDRWVLRSAQAEQTEQAETVESEPAQLEYYVYLCLDANGTPRGVLLADNFEHTDLASNIVRALKLTAKPMRLNAENLPSDLQFVLNMSALDLTQLTWPARLHITTTSLASLAADPAGKKAAWQAMQPILALA